MGRKRTGTAYPTEGGYIIQITTKDSKRPKHTIPSPWEGKAVTLAAARKVAHKCQTLYDAGHPVPYFKLNQEKPKEAPTVLEYAKKCLASQDNLSDRRDVEVIIKHHIAPSKMAQLKMGQVSKADVRDWVAELKQKKPQNNPHEKLSAKYIIRIYQVLSYLFQLGAEYDDYYDPCSELSTRRLLPAPVANIEGQDKVYSQEAIVSLLSDPRIKADRRVLYALYFFTGLRANEAPAIRFKNYEPSTTPLGRLTITKAFRKRQESSTKTKTTHLIPVHPTLAVILGDWQSKGFEVFSGHKPTPEDFLVPNADLTPKTYSAIYTAFKRDCRLVGITPKRLHDTRATFISTALDDGANRDALKRVTHPSPKADVFDTYDQVAWRRVCRAMSALKIELPTKEQKTMENALNNASLEGQGEQTLMNKGLEEQKTVNPIYSKESAFVAIWPYSSSDNQPTPTKDDKHLSNNAPQVAIKIPLGIYTGEALCYAGLELSELKDMGVL